MPRPNLVKVWQDWQPTVVQKMGNREYIRVPQLPEDYHRFSGKQLLKLLLQVVEWYKQQYPEHNYQAVFYPRKTKKYLVIKRGNIKTWKLAKDIPLYIDLQTGSWYVPKWYIKRNPKLTAFMIGYRVSAVARIIRRHLGMPEVTRERKPAKKPQRKRIAIICPKCGQPGFVTKRYTKDKDKEYYYVGHKVKIDGKWTTKWHYLGPELPISIKKQLQGGIE